MTGPDLLPVLDVDQHYYEPLDAFTRHRPKEWRERTVQTAVIDGRTRQIVGGKINHTVTNPTFDPIVKPGAMADYFRGNPQKRSLLDILSEREPIPSHYRNRDDRLAKNGRAGPAGGVDAAVAGDGLRRGAAVRPTRGRTGVQGLQPLAAR